MAKRPARPDVSRAWPVHRECGVRHGPTAECPPVGRWLAEWNAGRIYIPRQRGRRK